MAEFSLIQNYFNRHQPQPADLGIGDDAAVLTPPAGQQLVICTDTLVAGRHFPLSTAAHAVGWKSVAVNLSDIAAMGAKPHSILLALTLPEADPDWLEHFSRGLFDCCEQFGVSLIGGDTTQGPQLTISVTALGWAETGQAISRSGARPGDYICVSGQVGDAAYGLTHPGHALQQRLDYPTPRCELGQQLKGLASAMIDVSDGLAQDLGHILQASRVGARLDLNSLPLDPVLQQLSPDEQLRYALAGGDDYELCFTLRPAAFEKLLQQQSPVKITKIGHITEQPGLVFEKDGTDHPVQFYGYQHFV